MPGPSISSKVKALFCDTANAADDQIRALTLENQQLLSQIESLKQQCSLEIGASAANKINGPPWPITFNADGLVTVHNCDFMRDPIFQAAYKKGVQTQHGFGPNLQIEWRIFIACWAAHHAAQLEGDFVECGVNTGIMSSAVMKYVEFSKLTTRIFYLLDTYNGIPLQQLSEAEREQGIEDHNRWYSDCYELAIETFAPYQNARIIKGMVPETLEQIDSDRVCYVSIDMNCVEPEIAAGEYLWPRLVKGAVMILDDYGWLVHINQKHAWDEFAQERGLKVLALPTGQGLLIKP